MKKEGKDSGLAAVLSGLNEKKNPKPEKEEKEKLENPEAEVKNSTAIPEEETPSDAQETQETREPEEDKISEEEYVPADTESEVSRPKKVKKKRSKREIRIAVLGILTSFFVVVGVISTIHFIIVATRNIVDSTELKEELAYAVFPLVIVDAPEFETPESLDSSVIISSSIWRLILDADMDTYVKDDVGGITVPDADVEYYVRQLYGNGVAIVHQTIPDASVEMSYSAENKSYLIESTPVLLPYTPRVDEVQRNGDIYTIRVSYILPDVTWNLSPSYRNETVEKVMQFTLEKVDGHYQVLSSKLLEVINNPNESSEEATSSLPEESVSSSEESVSEAVAE